MKLSYNRDFLQIQPDTVFTFNQKIEYEENKHIEFKAVQDSKKPIDAIRNYLKEYLNAFINSQGGSILFGISDDQTIKGIFFTQKEKDDVRLAVDGICNAFVPQVDQKLTKIDFIPVMMTKTQIESNFNQQFIFQNQNDTLSYTAVLKNNANQDLVLYRYVVIISILTGISPVYFTNRQREAAFMRREGGNIRMTQELIMSRLTNGRGASSLEQSNYKSEFQFLGRQNIIQQVMDFLKNSVQQTKIISLYGIVDVGKSTLAEYIKQLIISDKTNFPDSPKVYTLDLKGRVEKHLSTTEALIQLIRSIKPDLDLNHILNEYNQNSNDNNVAESSFFSGLNLLESQFLPNYASQQKYKCDYQTPLQQELQNIYFNLVSQNKLTLLLLENVGKAQIAAKLIPQGTNCIVFCTSRKITGMELYINQQTVKYLEINIPPLSEQEGVLLVMQFLPQISVFDAENITKLCSGLPQVIKMLCCQCRQLSIQPQQLIHTLSQKTIQQRIKYFSPQMYTLLSNLNQQHTFALAKLSLFPAVFTEDAACCVLGITRVDHVFSQQKSVFKEILDLGLIDSVRQQVISIQISTLYKITDAVREFCYQNVNKQEIQQILDKYVFYFRNLLILLKNQYEAFQQSFSMSNKQKQKEQQINEIQQQQQISQQVHNQKNINNIFETAVITTDNVLELFIMNQPNFIILLKIIKCWLSDQRPDVRGKGVESATEILKSLFYFNKLFTQSLIFVYDQVGALLHNKQQPLNTIKQPTEQYDFQIWSEIYI